MPLTWSLYFLTPWAKPCASARWTLSVSATYLSPPFGKFSPFLAQQRSPTSFFAVSLERITETLQSNCRGNNQKIHFYLSKADTVEKDTVRREARNCHYNVFFSFPATTYYFPAQTDGRIGKRLFCRSHKICVGGRRSTPWHLTCPLSIYPTTAMYVCMSPGYHEDVLSLLAFVRRSLLYFPSYVPNSPSSPGYPIKLTISVNTLITPSIRWCKPVLINFSETAICCWRPSTGSWISSSTFLDG